MAFGAFSFIRLIGSKWHIIRKIYNKISTFNIAQILLVVKAKLDPRLFWW